MPERTHPTRNARAFRCNVIDPLLWIKRKRKSIIVHTVSGTGNECGLSTFTRDLYTREFFGTCPPAHCRKLRETLLCWWHPARSTLCSTSRRNEFMRKLLLLGMTFALTAAPMLAAPADNEKETDRLTNAGMVMEEIMNIPDNIPQDLLDKAECVVVFPSVLKAAFIVGGSYGRGAMICRSGEHFTGPWGAPSMAALEGGSLGFQLGGQATDFVLLIMNPRGATAILSSKVKLGARS